MKDLQKYFTIRIKGKTFVPTIEDKQYLFKLHYDVNTYPIIKKDYTKEGWKIIKQGIKENLYINLKRKGVL